MYGRKGYSAFSVIDGLATAVAPLIVIVVAPKDAAEAMAPHLFVLMAQCSIEFLAFKTWFHPLPRLLIPLGFTAYREQMLTDWVMAALEQYQANSDNDWAKGGLVLAIVNMVLLIYTLFSFLLMQVLQKYLDTNVSLVEPELGWVGFVWPVKKDREKA